MGLHRLVLATLNDSVDLDHVTVVRTTWHVVNHLLLNDTNHRNGKTPSFTNLLRLFNAVDESSRSVARCADDPV